MGGVGLHQRKPNRLVLLTQESGKERTLPPGLDQRAGVSDPSRRRTRPSLGFISKKNIRSIQHRPSCSASRAEAISHLGPPRPTPCCPRLMEPQDLRGSAVQNQSCLKLWAKSGAALQEKLSLSPISRNSDDEPEDHRNGARECPRFSRGRLLALQPSSIQVPLRASSPRTQESKHWKGF